jgi:hypothetical protein
MSLTGSNQIGLKSIVGLGPFGELIEQRCKVVVEDNLDEE